MLVQPERMESLSKRITEKELDYTKYSFTVDESRALAIFFDLAQEFDNLTDLYTVSVLIPKHFFNRDAVLYILNRENVFERTQGTADGDPTWEGDRDRLEVGAFFSDGCMFAPVRGNPMFIDNLLLTPLGRNCIGVLEIRDCLEKDDPLRLFLEKYGNRIGFQVHNKMINLRNREHIAFVQKLVADIGHNVIVPNMYFKLLLNRVEREIAALGKDRNHPAGEDGAEACAGLSEIRERFREVVTQFEQTSLFMESLLRRSHFEQGHYVLVKRPCNLVDQVIEPQLRRFRSRLEERGIMVDPVTVNCPLEELVLKVDVGLIGQAVANLLSNAVKYTKPSPEDGQKRIRLNLSTVSVGEKCMLKFSVITTGPPISEAEQTQLFQPRFRGEQSADEPGTGHGLFFIRDITELHGGQAGYETTTTGNNFFLLLPCARTAESKQESQRRLTPR